MVYGCIESEGMMEEQAKAAFCPACKYFMQDCNPEVEDYDKPCDSFEDIVLDLCYGGE